MATLDSDHHLRCTNDTCGFVVGESYFYEKQRFRPGIFPACGGVIRVVEPYTETRSTTHFLQVDPRNRSYRRVIPNPTPGGGP